MSLRQKLSTALLVFFLIGLTSLPSFCQIKYTNHWNFHFQLGLDFSSGVPVQDSSAADFSINGGGETCTSISDKNTGELLFYTNGMNVYTRNHTIMQNGTGLLGFWTPTQILIVPMPGSASKYYIFAVADNGEPNGLSYSVVDMTLNAGLGAVTAVKNVSLNTVSAEKIAGVKNCNGNDYWVIVTNQYNNAFYSYPVTSMGILSPVVSTTGSSNIYPRTLGYMKVSPNGKRISKAYFNNIIGQGTSLGPLAEVFDFNNYTGQVSNPIALSFPGFGYTYGTEFSPNSNLVYFSARKLSQRCFTYQFDLSTFNDAAVNNSKVFIDSTVRGDRTLQLASDGKIYGSDLFSLAVINNPNAVGLLCNFQPGGFHITGSNYPGDGLPGFVSSFFDTTTTVNCNVTPVTLLTFDVIKNNDIPYITWKTATELNADKFEIERSNDGISFRKIGQVSASGNANTTRSYYFADQKTPVICEGKNLYYRLKLSDLDGKATYSPVREINCSGNVPVFSVWPNPFSETLTINTTITEIGNTFIIFDQVGKQVLSGKINSTTTKVNVAQLAAGVYFIKVSKLTQRIIKRNIQ